jgi:hypothetical protein
VSNNKRSENAEQALLLNRYGGRLGYLMQWRNERQFLVNVYAGLPHGALPVVFDNLHNTALALINKQTALTPAEQQTVQAYHAMALAADARLPDINIIFNEWLHWLGGEPPISSQGDGIIVSLFDTAQMVRHNQFVSWWGQEHRVPYPQIPPQLRGGAEGFRIGMFDFPSAE